MLLHFTTFIDEYDKDGGFDPERHRLASHIFISYF